MAQITTVYRLIARRLLEPLPGLRHKRVSKRQVLAYVSHGLGIELNRSPRPQNVPSRRLPPVQKGGGQSRKTVVDPPDDPNYVRTSGKRLADSFASFNIGDDVEL